MPTDRQPTMNNTDPASSTNTTSTPVTTTTSDGTRQDSIQKRHSCTYDMILCRHASTKIQPTEETSSRN